MFFRSITLLGYNSISRGSRSLDDGWTYIEVNVETIPVRAYYNPALMSEEDAHFVASRLYIDRRAKKHRFISTRNIFLK